jgi:hypothetical protein
VKSSLEKLRASQEDSRKNVHDSQEEQNDLSKNSNDSRAHAEQKEIRILQKLVALFEEKIESSQLNFASQVRELEMNSASRERNHRSRNFEFVQQNSRRNHNASEIAYRVAYINK